MLRQVHNCLRTTKKWRTIRKKKAFALFLAAALLILMLPKGKAQSTGFTDGVYTCQLTADDTIIITAYNGIEAELTIPQTLFGKTVGGIGPYAFVGHQTLTALTLPQGLKTIGEAAFYACDKLKKVILPDSLLLIEDKAFSNCPASCDIKLPEGLLIIGYGVFYQCGSLSSLTLPGSLTVIQQGAFGANDKLQAFEVSPDNPVFEALDGVLFDKKSKTLLSYPAGKPGLTYTVPPGTLSVGDFSFIQTPSLEEITVMEGVETIGEAAFFGCSSLKQIALPDTVVKLGTMAFIACSALSSFRLPAGLTEIEENTFEFCDGLVSIVIPDKVTTIGSFAFKDCSNLTRIDIPDSVSEISDTALEGCDSLSAVVSQGSYAQSFMDKHHIPCTIRP